MPRAYEPLVLSQSLCVPQERPRGLVLCGQENIAENTTFINSPLLNVENRYKYYEGLNRAAWELQLVKIFKHILGWAIDSTFIGVPHSTGVAGLGPLVSITNTCSVG